MIRLYQKPIILRKVRLFLIYRAEIRVNFEFFRLVTSRANVCLADAGDQVLDAFLGLGFLLFEVELVGDAELDTVEDWDEGEGFLG